MLGCFAFALLAALALFVMADMVLKNCFALYRGEEPTHQLIKRTVAAAVITLSMGVMVWVLGTMRGHMAEASSNYLSTINRQEEGRNHNEWPMIFLTFLVPFIGAHLWRKACAYEVEQAGLRQTRYAEARKKLERLRRSKELTRQEEARAKQIKTELEEARRKIRALLQRAHDLEKTAKERQEVERRIAIAFAGDLIAKLEGISYSYDRHARRRRHFNSEEQPPLLLLPPHEEPKS